MTLPKILKEQIMTLPRLLKEQIMTLPKDTEKVDDDLAKNRDDYTID